MIHYLATSHLQTCGVRTPRKASAVVSDGRGCCQLERGRAGKSRGGPRKRLMWGRIFLGQARATASALLVLCAADRRESAANVLGRASGVRRYLIARPLSSNHIWSSWCKLQVVDWKAASCCHCANEARAALHDCHSTTARSQLLSESCVA